MYIKIYNIYKYAYVCIYAYTYMYIGCFVYVYKVLSARKKICRIEFVRIMSLHRIQKLSRKM